MHVDMKYGRFVLETSYYQNYTVEVGLKPTPSGFRKSCHTVTGALASHADVLRGSSSVPAPLTSADLSGKKRRPITADFKIWEVYFAGP